MKLAHVLLVAVSMSLGGSLVACGGAEPNAEDDETMDELRGKTLTLTDADDGKTVTLETGKTLKVKLSANATTGYAWRVKSVDRTLGQPTISYKADGGGAVGSGGVTTLSWKLTSPLDLVGTHKVELEYQRPWAETAPPAKKFSFTLKVVKAGTPIGRAEGEMCGGFANLPCADGLKCVFGNPPSGAAADMSGICRAPKSCVVSGCNGEICGDTSRVSICIARPEFACYRKPGVKCEQQATGSCGWSLTTEAKQCLTQR
jgi:predicted secreted protein